MHPESATSNRCIAAAHHFNLATALGAEVVRSMQPGCRLGTVLALNWIEPATDRDADIEAARQLEDFYNWSYLEPLRSGRYPERIAEHFEPWLENGDVDRLPCSLDLLGINYYTRAASETPTRLPAAGGPYRASRPRPRNDCDGLGSRRERAAQAAALGQRSRARADARDHRERRRL